MSLNRCYVHVQEAVGELSVMLMNLLAQPERGEVDAQIMWSSLILLNQYKDYCTNGFVMHQFDSLPSYECGRSDSACPLCPFPKDFRNWTPTHEYMGLTHWSCLSINLVALAKQAQALYTLLKWQKKLQL